MSNLLFIDDDKDVLELNSKFFKKSGYSVRTASSLKEGLIILDSFSPDCIILDIMMPEQNGYTALKKIRQFTSAPIIFLSGLSDETNKLKGLTIGANDYITKPYSLKELNARIQIQLRTTNPSDSGNIISFPPLAINILHHKAYYNTEEISLSNREFTLLLILASNPNQAITFEEIGREMWEVYSPDDRKTIMVTASRLRKKLENYSGLSTAIETVWSKGYKFTLL